MRVHPSFRFEERLARRLAEAAAGMRLAAAAGGEGTILPFPGAADDLLAGDPRRRRSSATGAAGAAADAGGRSVRRAGRSWSAAPSPRPP